MFYTSTLTFKGIRINKNINLFLSFNPTIHEVAMARGMLLSKDCPLFPTYLVADLRDLLTPAKNGTKFRLSKYKKIKNNKHNQDKLTIPLRPPPLPPAPIFNVVE